MNRSFNQGNQSGRVVLFDEDVQAGRDWRLAVQSSAPGTVRVIAQWAGGRRQVIEEDVGPVARVFALPTRIPGSRLIVECQVDAGPAHIAADLAWTPDVGWEAPCSCGC